MNTTKQMSLIVLLMVLGGGFFAYYVTWPNYTALNRYKRNLDSVSSELSSLNEKKSLITQLEGAEPTLTQQSQVAENLIPSTEQRELFVSQIDALAQLDGVKLNTFAYTEAAQKSTKGEEEGGTTASKTATSSSKNEAKALGYTAAVTGSYQQVERFMIDLEHMTRYGQVKSFSMNPSNNSAASADAVTAPTAGVSASLTGTIYTKALPKIPKTLTFSGNVWQYLADRLTVKPLTTATRVDPFVKP